MYPEQKYFVRGKLEWNCPKCEFTSMSPYAMRTHTRAHKKGTKN